MIDPILYSWHPEPLTIILLCGTAVAALWLLGFNLPKLRFIVAKSRKDSEDARSIPPCGVSIIVCSATHADSLPACISNILSQNYDAPVEIIIVNTGGEEYTENIIRAIQSEHPQIKNTFVPSGSRNLSRRKLAITLGIKAATQPVVLLTAANAVQTSLLWLASMMRHFADNTDIVIGATTLKGKDSGRTLGISRSFDAMVSAIRNHTAAAAGKPIGADSANLAYRRQIFFDHKGFSDSLNLNYGDDDLFISDISKEKTVAVELSPQAILEIREENPARVYDMEKASRDITRSKLRKMPFILSGFTTIFWWIWLTCSIAAAISGLPSLLPLAIVVLIALAIIIPTLIFWRKAARALSISSSCTSMIPLALIHPLTSIRRKIRIGRSIRNYTWQN
jgi:glycosyltransferase involved in cell wall biosynthesis